MKDSILRKLFLGFIQVHILYHAAQEPIYGVYMIEELKKHGYIISAGTLYPLLHSMEKANLLTRQEKLVSGKVRKYYTITGTGAEVLQECKLKAKELVEEIEEA